MCVFWRAASGTRFDSASQPGHSTIRQNVPNPIPFDFPAYHEGNFQSYELDHQKRLGLDADRPRRIKYRKLTKA